jgi:hypothetical protein
MMIKALTNSKNIPKVTIVIGNVNTTSIGFTIKLRADRASATHNAVKNPSVETPGKTYDNSITSTAVIRSLRIKFIIKILSKNRQSARKLIPGGLSC